MVAEPIPVELEGKEHQSDEDTVGSYPSLDPTADPSPPYPETVGSGEGGGGEATGDEDNLEDDRGTKRSRIME